ncbi:unnamed protein product [Cuscuta epithymum]|uniref:Uncharacterized protein n=1 Tax=Cuscuta epithymum TaxID=186058 RepID=A0AAV0DNF6_9ASTE|nr:unnamed protein product [Cuscuta epithymum]
MLISHPFKVWGVLIIFPSAKLQHDFVRLKLFIWGRNAELHSPTLSKKYREVIGIDVNNAKRFLVGEFSSLHTPNKKINTVYNEVKILAKKKKYNEVKKGEINNKQEYSSCNPKRVRNMKKGNIK